MLLVEHWLGFSPAYITPVLDVACYLLAFKYLGFSFIRTSVLSTACVSLFYKLWEQFPPMLPDLSDHPWQRPCWADCSWVWAWGSLCGRELFRRG